MKNKEDLFDLVSPCGCVITFCFRWFGFSHWWRYTKLRYYWRLFWTKFRYIKVEAYGTTFWIDRANFWVYNCFPGPNMTNDEYEHWFVKKEKR